jgi:ParB-like chromosome segregation protein Spo0J
MKKQSYPCIQKKKLAELVPNQRNPRTISAESLQRLQKSLETLGNLQPVVWNARSKKLIGGHQRIKCLAELGHEETEVWCVDLDEEKEKAALLALNRNAGEWDNAALKDLLEELDSGKFDMDLTGFGHEDIEKLMLQFHVEAPAQFPTVDENLKTEHECPKCHYRWSGKKA